MTAEGETPRHFDEKMIADLRAWRDQPRVAAGLREKGETSITLGELEALLRAVDERDALKREACETSDDRPSNVTPIGREAILGEFVTMRVDEWRRVTDELSRLRTDEATRLDAALEEDERVIAWDQIATHPFFRECYGTKGSLLDAMLAKLTASTFEAPIPDEVRERAGVSFDARACRYCGQRILLFAEGWLHDASEPDPGGHPAAPLPAEITHATMCGASGGGSCFVPWCRCDCHLRRYDVAPVR